jgi:hypothetical protein
MTTEEFEKIVTDWITTARHPKTGRLYTEPVYQPMVQLLAYLRANGFKTFIVDGGGIEFMRPWMERVYGIPPEQVVGSSIKTKFELRDGKPVLVRLRELNFIVHHTDAEREWAYDRESSIGKLDKAWDEAKRKNWTVVDMKTDWKNIFAFEP